MTGAELLADRYELRGLLGRGGMAEVRDGWDTRLQRPVAVKLMHPAMQVDETSRRRFTAEARSAAGLTHPNIVSIHDFGEHDGTPFIVMERLPGRTLADLCETGPLPAPRVRAILGDVLAALAIAHAAGVVHRDIKPGNILLSANDDFAKVADFGIAKSGGTSHTVTGQILGTLCYMSPERVTGAPASVADDLYAVGVMGYEALLGRRAFPHDNPAALARAIVDTPPPPLAALGPPPDPILGAVIDRAMSRDPGARFVSASQMRAALYGDPHALHRLPAVTASGGQHGQQAPTVRMRPPDGPPGGYVPFSEDPFSSPARTRVYLLAAAALAVTLVVVLALAAFPAAAP